MKKERTWRWVTAVGVSGVEVWSRATKPTINVYGTWSQNERFDTTYICRRQWNALFGINVPTDKAIKVEFTGKEIE